MSDVVNLKNSVSLIYDPRYELTMFTRDQCETVNIFIKKMSADLDEAGNNLFIQEGKIKELEAENKELKELLENADETIKEIFSLGRKSFNYESAYHQTYYICEDYLCGRNIELNKEEKWII